MSKKSICRTTQVAMMVSTRFRIAYSKQCTLQPPLVQHSLALRTMQRGSLRAPGYEHARNTRLSCTNIQKPPTRPIYLRILSLSSDSMPILDAPACATNSRIGPIACERWQSVGQRITCLSQTQLAKSLTAAVHKLCMSAPENPSVSRTISCKSSSGSTVPFFARRPATRHTGVTKRSYMSSIKRKYLTQECREPLPEAVECNTCPMWAVVSMRIVDGNTILQWVEHIGPNRLTKRRRAASSNSCGRLVAPTTRIRPPSASDPTPSSCTRNSVLIRRVDSISPSAHIEPR